MNSLPLATQPAGLNLGDIYYILFRHKWKILLCATVGCAGAASMYVFRPPPYQSEAELLVKYVISDSKAFGAAGGESAAKSPDRSGETIMKTEVAILGSADLAKRVVDIVGAEKILAKVGGGKNPEAAQFVIKNNLTVFAPPSTTVIGVTFRHPDPELVQPVLNQVIAQYKKLHSESHTAGGMAGDFLTREADQVKAQLTQTEEELRKATLKAGIVSLEDAKKAYSDQLTAIRRDLFNAEGDLAQKSAILQELNKRFPAPSGEADSADAPLSSTILAEHRNLLQQVERLQRTEQELLTQFLPENDHVKEIRSLLATAVEQRNKLEQLHPKLTSIAASSVRGAEATAIDGVTAAIQIAALKAQIKVLNQQLEQVHVEAARVEEMEGTIVALRRKKDQEDQRYRYYSASLDQSIISETLSSGRVQNIAVIQNPSPPVSDRSKSNKVVGILLVSGLLGGIGWAFLIELYLDRSVKRSVDIERLVRVPLFLAIPKLSRKQLSSSPLLLDGPNGSGQANGNASGTGKRANDRTVPGAAGKSADAAGPESLHPLQPFHETLRDRLIGYFESVNLTHKPKLVAVTGLGHNSGVTTTAAGLARSLSETGEGNVLLVDMNVGQGVAQQFMHGKAARGLDELLETRDDERPNDKLCIVSESNNSERLSRNMPQRFTKLVPKLKASDFDYIIFDMPPVNQISITPRLASFMDMVLVVVESEKTNRDLVQRATSLLSESRTHVGLVLNKTRRYVPKALYQDHLGNS